MIITVLAVVAAVGLTLMATMASLVKQMNGANKDMSQGLSHLQDQLGGLIIALRQLNDDLRSRNITMQRKLDDLGEFTEVMKNILKVEILEDKAKRTAMFSAHLASIEDTLMNLRADVQQSSPEAAKAMVEALKDYAKEIEASIMPAVENKEMEQLLDQALNPETQSEGKEEAAQSEAGKVFVAMKVMTVEERYHAMKKMKEEGKSLMEIANAFGLKNRSSVTRFMKRNAKKFEK